MFDYQTMTLNNNQKLQYVTILPLNFKPEQRYPILLALPPGDQSRAMVDWGLTEYWAHEAVIQGWVVISPTAPEGQLFFHGAETVIPEFLTRIAKQHPPEGDKFHIGGISNGGHSGFRLAVEYPELFHSLTVLPGYPPTPDDFQRLDKLANIPVTMFVGAGDKSWVESMRKTKAKLNRLHIPVTLEIVSGEGHVIQSLMGGQRLFALLNARRPG